MGLFYKANKGHLIDFTLELKGEWYNEIREETRSRFLAPEWYAQSGVEIVWPTEETDWAYMLDEVTEVYIRMTYEIASRERLLIVTSAPEKIDVILKRHMPAKALDNITIAESEINDTWARDTSFLTVLGPNGAELMDFKFNGWGNKFEASKDNAINRNLFGNNYFKGTYTDCNNYVLEGGSIEVDAQGSLLTTESCLLTPTRNPQLNKADIEIKLKRFFNVSNILWLSHGHLEGDDTDGHIDTLARLCPQGKIAYVKCYDKNDCHYESLSLMEKELQSFRQPSGEPYELVPLPLPEPVYAPADENENSERLPATYANYLIINNAVLLPVYNQPENDETAAKAIQRLFPRYEVVRIPCLPLLRQHGSLHCSTMQFPANVLNTKAENKADN